MCSNEADYGLAARTDKTTQEKSSGIVDPESISSRVFIDY
jgi:hypothetical protein